MCQDNSARFLLLGPSDVATTIEQFQADHKSGVPLVHPRPLDKEFSGIPCNDKIVGIVHHYLRRELIFVTTNEQTALGYLKLHINKDRRPFSLLPYQPPADQKGAKRASQLKERLPVTVPSEVQQLYYIPHENSAFLLVLRKNQQMELVFNFAETLLAETSMNVDRILGCFGAGITYLFHDGSIGQAKSFESLNKRDYLQDAEYYRGLTLPPASST
jgi:hypothetical protein